MEGKRPAAHTGWDAGLPGQPTVGHIQGRAFILFDRFASRTPTGRRNA
jgi:hypothetical protein